MSPRSRHIFSGLIISLVLLAGFLGWSNSATAQNKLGDLGLSQIQPELGLGTTDIRVMVARIIRVALTFLGVVALGLMSLGLTACSRRKQTLAPPPQPVYAQQPATYGQGLQPPYPAQPQAKKMKYVSK